MYYTSLHVTEIRKNEEPKKPSCQQSPQPEKLLDGGGAEQIMDVIHLMERWHTLIPLG
jgi:hypothetical protein